ncbi:hypothetical protein [Arhodomonas sp. AD133]|uniref:hypothetical protein n=1 Tax=Arhodomonas sp. AD133 TaxID=3415009 RepID=UPI003EBB9505
MQMISLRKAIGGAIAAAILTAAAAPTHALELRFGHGGTEDTAYHAGAKRFQEALESASDGDLSVTILPNSVLGHETEMFEQQMAGA